MMLNYREEKEVLNLLIRMILSKFEIYCNFVMYNLKFLLDDVYVMSLIE